MKSNYASLLYDEVTTRGLEVELVVERETLESAAAVVRGREELSELFAADEVDLLVTDASLPYALWQTTAAPAEGEGNRGAAARAGVAVHDGGAVVGLLASDAAAAVEWACEVYERFRADAEPLRAGRLATD